MTARRRLLQAAGAGVLLGVAGAHWRAVRAQPGPLFALGVASGQPQPDTVVLWTRLMGEALPAEVPVRWQVALDEGFGQVVASGQEIARPADAHSVHAEPRGLAPDRPYWYRFEALDQRSAVGRTRTAPRPDQAVDRLRWVIASCQRWDVGHYAAWRDVAEQPPDLVMFLGDYLYEYGSSAQALRPHQGGLVRTLADYRQRHAQYKSDPALQAAHAACPWLFTWDDHEVDNDYAGLQGQSLQSDFAQQRAAAYQAYWEHMPLPAASRPQQGSMRMHGRLDWGRLARIHWLDNRQYRDPQVCPRPGRGGSTTVLRSECEALADPNRTLLGADQEAWLAQGWSLQRPWNLLAQQTLFSRFAWEDPAGPGRGRWWTDGWDGYPAARQRLLATLQQRQVPGVVVMGGDVHANYVANVRADFDDPASTVLASEFCGTSISSLGLAQERLDAALPLNPHILWGRSDQRGTVRFELTPARLQAELRVVADARRADSPVGTAARWVVQAGQPAIQRA